MAPLPADLLLLDPLPGAADLFEANTHLGESVAIDGAILAAGAPYADAGELTDAGAVCVFMRAAGWSGCTRIDSPRPFPYDRFGASVAVTGGTLVVGANRHDGAAIDAGNAYVFERGEGEDGGFGFRQELAPGDLPPAAGLGYSAAISGSSLALGAPGMAAVLVFARRGGSFAEVARLTPPAPAAYSGFGHAVALDGELLVVGANTHPGPEGSMLAGAAFVYRRTDGGWQLEQRLQSPREEALARFGTTVAVRGGRILVGASRATVGDSTRAGAAFLFERRGDGKFVSVAELQRDKPRSDEELARAIALLPEAALLGSQFGDAAGLNTGGALLFLRSGGEWRQRATLLASDRAQISELAYALAADDSTVVLGAPRRNSKNTATGGIYLFSLPPR
jgi:hypothetical protein